jgi:hypothetical protein
MWNDSFAQHYISSSALVRIFKPASFS